MDTLGLIPTFGNFAWTIIAFIAALSIIVAVHEYGHYIVGRWSGIHAEVFSIGFGKILFSRVDKRGTRWQIAALPFGGYVKFLGDSNAASGKDGEAITQLSPEERRHTMHGAPLWARAATVAAGPIFNFILSIVVFAGVYAYNGIATDQAIVGKMNPGPFDQQALHPGDRIIGIGGIDTPDFETFVDSIGALPLAETYDYRLVRDGQEINVAGPYPMPPIIGAVQPISAAQDAGLLPGDVIVQANETPVFAFDQLREIVGNSDGKPIQLSVWRDGKTLSFTMTPRRSDVPKAEGGFETRWLIGLSPDLTFTPEIRKPGPIETLQLAVSKTWDVAATNLSFLWNIAAGQVSSCNVSGPIGIAKVSGAAATQGSGTFILLIAGLSTSVGLLNLFPVPILDGGHLVFHAWEAVTGKPPSDTALRILMAIGLAALVTLMVFALGNDIFC